LAVAQHFVEAVVTHSVRSHLRVEIDEYDTSIRRFIPGYDEMIAAAVDAALAAGPRRLLDVGAGTGALSAAVLERAPDVTVELLDVDEEMLARARSRLSPFGPRVVFTVGSFYDPLPRAGAVLASLSLHHVPTLEAKGSLFRRVREALEPGGVLVNADVTMPAADPERARTWRDWADHLVSCGIAEEEAWRHFQEWAEEDTYFAIEDELRLLEEAGLAAECVWRKGVSTVVVGRRA
jgi:tRNA (cmo5U34)-methyltransferase